MSVLVFLLLFVIVVVIVLVYLLGYMLVYSFSVRKFVMFEFDFGSEHIIVCFVPVHAQVLAYI